jgi:hypothetical protein
MRPHEASTNRRLGLALAACLTLVSIALPTGLSEAIPPEGPPALPCERPHSPASCFAASPTGTLTAVSRPPSGVLVSGTANDPDAPGPVEVTVHVSGSYVGSVWADGPGGEFSGTVTPRAGSQVCVRAINRNDGDDALLGCRQLEVRVNPFGQLEEVATTAGGLRVRGWVIDPDTTAPARVRLLVDGFERQEVVASGNRPDVAAANPAYGNQHGFNMTLPGGKRHTSVCALGVNVGPGSGNTRLGCGRDPHAVSVLTLNLRGTHNEWENDNGVGITTIPWRERYGRLASWMADTGTLPDLIALQEVPARKFWWSPYPHLEPPDYESLFVLIDQISRRTGAQYRIAYLSADYVHEGLQPLHQGRALIYNADRVRNTTALVNSWAVAHNDTKTTGVHMRTSWPCDQPSPAFAGRCDLIDLDGRHWVSAYTHPATGQWARGPQAAVFELVSDPGKHIIVINVHAHRDADPDDQLAIRTLVATVWSAWAPRNKLIPPIVAGDLNGSPDLPDGEPTLPDFDTTATEYVEYVLIGKPSAYPSMYAPAAETLTFPSRTPFAAEPPGERGYCGTLATVLSDHCAVFAQYLPIK